MKLKGQTAIVTGGGRGIGRAICQSLAGEGANIVIVARTEREIRETARLVEKQGVRALAVKTDIRKEEEVINMVSKAVNAFGRIDILVNNAGVAYGKYLVETSTEEYNEIMDTNVKGMFFCTKYALPHLLKRGEGRIVNISSGAGKRGIPKLSIYCASKFAVIGFMRSALLAWIPACTGRCRPMSQSSNPKMLQKRFWNSVCLKQRFLQAPQSRFTGGL